ncbi:MAG: CotH kinase family protein [Bacteroides sp.]|nr:CotH kinase family protein [Bacteroides sp.]MCM1379706.1 CotH kinase family protein [Bacteroides sp.]MCM1446061.1 CotH kinase family protein [Prevotella sp.]
MKHCLSFVGILLLSLFAPAGAQQPETNLSTIDITLADGQYYIQKDVYTDCTVKRLTPGAEPLTYSPARIKVRGNSTATLDKQPYRIKFSVKERMMGADRANAKNWVLLANHTDKSLIRNALAFRVAELAGMPFVPGTEFVDVRLNNKFVGNYHLTDHIDIRKKRIHITEQDTIPGADHNYTGGYLLEADGIGYREPVFFRSYGSGTTVVIKSPNEDVVNDTHMSYIADWFTEVEERVLSQEFDNPINGYRAMVDSVSLAAWYITNEVAANPDMFWSNYMYKDKDNNKLYFGPVWDFDIAFNNCVRKGNLTKRMMIDAAFDSYYGTLGVWFQQMWRDPWFKQLIWRNWRALADGGLKETLLTYADELAMQIDASQKLNFDLYAIDEAVYDEYKLFDSYKENITFLKQTISDRIDFLEKEFAERCDVGNTEHPVTPPDEPIVGPIGESEYVIPEAGNTYAIFNAGVKMPIAVTATGGVALADEAGAKACHWVLQPAANNTFLIVNAESGLAVYDDSKGVKNTPLTTATPDASDACQQWIFTRTPDEEPPTYCISNIGSQLAWNNSNGDAFVGNNIIAWTNDSQNFSKPTRQWLFAQITEEEEDNGGDDTPGDEKTDDQEASINDLSTPNYSVAYSRSLHRLRFAGFDGQLVQGTWNIYSLGGTLVSHGEIAPEVYIGNIEPGLYLLKWEVGNQTKTAKIVI